jgi:hypothetical protein
MKTQLKSLDRKSVERVRKALEESIQKISSDFGLMYVPKNVTYDPYGGHISFKCELVLSELKKKNTPFVGMKFSHNGFTFEILDYIPRRRKFPVVARNVQTGVIFKFTKQVCDKAK